MKKKKANDGNIILIIAAFFGAIFGIFEGILEGCRGDNKK